MAEQSRPHDDSLRDSRHARALRQIFDLCKNSIRTRSRDVEDWVDDAI